MVQYNHGQAGVQSFDQNRPTIAELTGDGHFAQLARTYWLNTLSKGNRASVGIIKNEIWDNLEKENFAYGSLLLLENLQILEK